MVAQRTRGRIRTPVPEGGRDRGQVTIEFLGMTPLILLTLVLLWQFVLTGYTWVLAGNAADEAVRKATAVSEYERDAVCDQAGSDKLPDAWVGGAQFDCDTVNGYVTARVSLDVPVLFPGSIAFPFTVEGKAGAIEEELGD
ncbi:TadE/TadG family type IV pilus assembly protein [Streptomyces sp. HD]|uniref:TadE/TadG family type IV pilus assembly protein n=1 Tax=Streptomyces sp. HD TaxID=3020892 RepID=UPI00232D99A3|nr:TadE/TadG family type IV pilus assembly protein [Streptomyces sp. HD]MDC0773972.1 pilus assembly protein [Streptomyces sp. HD]